MKNTNVLSKPFLPVFGLVIFVFLSPLTNSAQEAKSIFLEKKNQVSLGGELPVSISFSYTHRFSKYAVFGVQVQSGIGFRYLVNDPTFVYICDQCTEYYKERLRSITFIFIEIAKLQFFYRLALNRHLYLDMGPYISIGINSIEGGVAGPSSGLEMSAYYTTHGVFVGLRFQGGYYFTDFKTNKNHNYFGLYITPVVVGVNF